MTTPTTDPDPGAPAAPAGVVRVRTSRFAFTGIARGEGDLVLLLHGFPDGPETFASLAEAVAASGFRAVRVTLRGYETSSVGPSGAYTLADLAEDVFVWMDALGASRAHLVGHDWGSTIACAAAAARPDRVLSLTMIAVPHPARFREALAKRPVQAWRSSYMMFFQLRGFADWWVGRDAARFVGRIWRRWSPGWTPPAALLGAARRRLSDPRIRRAALDYYRCAFDSRHPRAMEVTSLLQQPIRAPTLAVYGDGDGCVGADVFRSAMTTKDFQGGLSLFLVTGAGHFAHVEKPAAVADALTRFLNDNRSPARAA